MNTFKQQLLPIVLTVLTFIILSILLVFFLYLLNFFPVKQKIHIIYLPVDILIGIIIYLKTSIDFTIFIGNLMHANPGWKKRIAIEIGTALGNGLGTVLVLTLWYFSKQTPRLMIIMILLASIILFEMAQEGLEGYLHGKNILFKDILFTLQNILEGINKFFHPFISRIIPDFGHTLAKPLAFKRLLLFSLSVPFILGLDDFSGYIPLFSVINVFSFVIGIFLAHMLLNIGLFAAPHKTTKVIRHPVVIIGGSLVFVGLAVFGIYEAAYIAYTLLYSH